MDFSEIVELIKSKLSNTIITSLNTRNIQPSITIERNRLIEIGNFILKQKNLYFDFLSCITGIDNGISVNTMELMYNFYSIPYHHYLTIKIIIERDFVDKETTYVPSISSLWRTANWHEREIYDLLGIRFKNHPDMRRIFMPSDWKGFPLRKDYTNPKTYHGIYTE